MKISKIIKWHNWIVLKILLKIIVILNKNAIKNRKWKKWVHAINLVYKNNKLA